MSKLVVFTGHLGYSVRRGIVEIDRAIPGLSWLIVVHSPRRSLVGLLTSQWRNFRRNGWRWVPYQLGEIVERVKSRRTKSTDAELPGANYSVAALRARQNIRILRVGDIHSPLTLKEVQAFESDLGISLGAPILRQSLFSIPRLGTLNLHKGKVPSYRGMPPAFWELWNDEKIVGCTVHWVESKLDAGDVVAEATIDRQKFSTVRGLQLCLDELGVKLMTEAVLDVLGGTSKPVVQAAGGKTYRKPTLAQVAALGRKLTKAAQSHTSLPPRFVKEVAFGVTTWAWYLGLRHILQPRVTVLLYHRVSDEIRNNLTVGIEQFERQMVMLREHCRVVSINAVLDNEGEVNGAKPVVCVTFDDGYLDNYLHAVPILVRYCIPATFFVSTGFVGTSRIFPHDERRNSPAPVMTWEQLRKIRELGFKIGSHSVNHIDCAKEQEEVVVAELDQSLDDLQRELGPDKYFFAYPYGGKEHMSRERLDLVRAAGYSGCLSAYGGVNFKSLDRFNILRCSINHEFSDRSFLVTSLGLRKP